MKIPKRITLAKANRVQAAQGFEVVLVGSPI
jgi:hypothetical protein